VEPDADGVKPARARLRREPEVLPRGCGRMRTLILHNPKAGEGRLSGDDLVALFRGEGHDVAYRDVKADGIDRDAAATADLIVVGGGDGTVGKAVRAIGDLGRPLMIVPLGTANNIARSLGVTLSPAALAKRCATCAERLLDLGIVKGPFGRRVFLEGVGIGAIAELVAAGDASDMSVREERRFGEEAPGVLLREARAQRWNGLVDGMPLPEELVLLEVQNMPLVGPNLPLGPGGSPDDGLLDVAFLRPEKREALARWFDGNREGWPDGLEVVRGRTVSFDWPQGPLLIDDHLPDPPAETARIELRLADAQLRVLVPAAEGDAG
jgi:diacylglycerol kinase (ATP)